MKSITAAGFVAALVLTLSTPVRGETLQSEHTFQRTLTVEQRINYLKLLPQGYDPDRTPGWPLILFLHGAGERGNDLGRVKWNGPSRFLEKNRSFPFLLVSPQCPDGQIWDDAILMGLLDSVIADLNVDTNKVYLTGLSMGGFGTWSLGLNHPGRFAAIAPVCGGGTPLSVLLADGRRKQLLRELPVWAFHGAKDRVVPLEESQRMVEALRGIGAAGVKLTVYPDANHDSWTQTYGQPDLFEWFLRH